MDEQITEPNRIIQTCIKMTEKGIFSMERVIDFMREDLGSDFKMNQTEINHFNKWFEGRVT